MLAIIIIIGLTIIIGQLFLYLSECQKSLKNIEENSQKSLHNLEGELFQIRKHLKREAEKEE